MSAPSPVVTVAERRRLEKLAAGLPPRQWIVAPEDPDAAVVAIAGPVSRSPLFAGVGPTPVAALHRVQAAGVRERSHLWAGPAALATAGWTHPIGLLCLPGTAAHAQSLMVSWGAHVVAGGHVVFYGGTGPHPGSLRLRAGYWIEHERAGGGLFLLTRRPYG